MNNKPPPEAEQLYPQQETVEYDLLYASQNQVYSNNTLNIINTNNPLKIIIHS